MSFWLFALGAVVGSFINVLAVRYDPDQFLFKKSSLQGRSYCPHCRSTLRWFELVPVVSFLLQRARCRHCSGAISFQYPVVEILCGLIFVFVPSFVQSLPGSSLAYYASTLWTLVFVTLLLITLIDMRLSIIPDEANIILGILGIVIAYVSAPAFGLGGGSFLGSYSFLFGYHGNIWMSRTVGVLFALVFFGVLFFLTRGRAMGVGDIKLGAVLGIVFGWPDILLIVALSFVFGSFFGAYVIFSGKKTMKSLVPFGPFLALASGAIFFFGYNLLDLYFKLVHI